MIKTTRQKIYDFNKPTAVYFQIAVSVLAEVYRTNYYYKGIKLKIKSVEAMINVDTNPINILGINQLKGFIFITEQGRFEIQLVDENYRHPYIHSTSYHNLLIQLNAKVENLIIKDIEHIKSDVGFKESYLVTLLNKTKPFEISKGAIPAKNITASSGNNIW